MSGNPARDIARQQRGQVVDMSGALCWYLAGDGSVIRGQVVRDPNWEDRKREQLGGLKFLGHAEYGPGGDAVHALRTLLPKNPELEPIIKQAEENAKQRSYDRAHREEAKQLKRAEENTQQATLIAQALRLADQTDEMDDGDKTETQREPGRGKSRQR